MAKTQDVIAANLAVIEAHFGSEAAGRIDAAIDLYTDDIVWEAPSRNLVIKGKEAVAANYREIFSVLKDVEFHTLDRFATEDRVVDDCVVTFEVARDGFIPLPLGTKAEMRLRKAEGRARYQATIKHRKSGENHEC